MVWLVVTGPRRATDLSAPTDIPPVGEVWFGQSFDTDTFAIRGRRHVIGVTDPFSFVAHLRRSVSGSDLAVRVYLDGTLASTTGVESTDSGELWGFSPGPLYAAGEWRYDLTDIGGNVLASGTVTAR